MDGKKNIRKITRREFMKISSGVLSATLLGTTRRAPFVKLDNLFRHGRPRRNYQIRCLPHVPAAILQPKGAPERWDRNDD